MSSIDRIYKNGGEKRGRRGERRVRGSSKALFIHKRKKKERGKWDDASVVRKTHHHLKCLYMETNCIRFFFVRSFSNRVLGFIKVGEGRGRAVVNQQ